MNHAGYVHVWLNPVRCENLYSVVVQVYVFCRSAIAS